MKDDDRPGKHNADSARQREIDNKRSIRKRVKSARKANRLKDEIRNREQQRIKDITD